MFKMIKDPAADVGTLVKSYRHIKAYMPELEDELKANHNRLVDLQQDLMSGDSSAKNKIKAAKDKRLDIETKQEACKAGIDKIRERIGKQLPDEAQAEILELEDKYDDLKAEEQSLYNDFFDAVAVAIAKRDLIMGTRYESDRHSETGLKRAVPSLDIHAHRHDIRPEDSVYLCQVTEKAQDDLGNFVPVERRLDKVRDRLDELRTMLEEYDPSAETDRVLNIN